MWQCSCTDPAGAVWCGKCALLLWLLLSVYSMRTAIDLLLQAVMRTTRHHTESIFAGFASAAVSESVRPIAHKSSLLLLAVLTA
jgi:hypothetical protein